MNVLDNKLFMGRFDQGLFSWNGTTLTTISNNAPAIYIRSLDGDIYDKSKLNQTITFADINKIYGNDDFNLNASSSSGLTSFTYTSSDPTVASITGSTVKILKTGTVTLTAIQAGNNDYYFASKSATLTIEKANPTISGDTQKSFTYKTSTNGYNGEKEVTLSELEITSNSSGTLSFAKYSDIDNNISYLSEGKLIFSKAGTVTIQVNQSENDLYNATSSTFDIVLSKIDPTISGINQKTFTYGISSSGYNITTGVVDLSAVDVSSDSSGTLSFDEYADPNNVASVSNNTLTFTKAGTVSIQVFQTAGDFHNELSSVVTFDITLNKASQEISVVDAILNVVKIPYQLEPWVPTLQTTASSGYSSYSFTSSVQSVAEVLRIDGTTILLKEIGSTLIGVTQAGNEFYTESTTSFTLEVEQATQTLTFNSMVKTIGDINFTPVVSTNSTILTDTTFGFSSNNSSIATVVNNNTQLRIVGVGSCTITATEPGNTYVASASKTATLTVTPYRLTVVGTTNTTTSDVRQCIYTWDGVGLSNYVDALGNIGVSGDVYDFTKDVQGNIYFIGNFVRTVKADESEGTVSAIRFIKWEKVTNTWKIITDSNDIDAQLAPF
jgi:hypothetical protein